MSKHSILNVLKYQFNTRQKKHIMFMIRNVPNRTLRAAHVHALILHPWLHSWKNENKKHMYNNYTYNEGKQKNKNGPSIFNPNPSTFAHLADLHGQSDQILREILESLYLLLVQVN